MCSNTEWEPNEVGWRYRASGWYRSDWADEKGQQRRPFTPIFTAKSDSTVLDLICNGLNRGEWT